MSALRRSKDRKVTNSVTDSGNARGMNAFGLPSGKAFSCPGATSVCERICYAGKTEKMYSAARALVMHNWNLLNGATQDEQYELIHAMITDFVAETDRTIAKGNDATYDFRIHWDGDFFSLDYAIAWARVIADFPAVRFWVYTRSFEYVKAFVGLENLEIYLSVDADNHAAAAAALEDFPFCKAATLGDTFEDAKRYEPEGKSYDCPENGKRMDLINKKGSACLRCGICPSGRGNVRFSISKK